MYRHSIYDPAPAGGDAPIHLLQESLVVGLFRRRLVRADDNNLVFGSPQRRRTATVCMYCVGNGMRSVTTRRTTPPVKSVHTVSYEVCWKVVYVVYDFRHRLTMFRVLLQNHERSWRCRKRDTGRVPFFF